MRYRLRDGLSYCISDGIAIFLDLDLDRYFRLPAPLERTFLNYIEGSRGVTAEIRALLEREILVPSEDGNPDNPLPQVATPTRSAVELEPTPKSSSAVLVPEALLTTWFVHRQMRTHPIKAVLEASAQHRRAHLPSVPRPPKSEAWLLETAARFRRARLHVPIPTRCLLDSLTLTRFLARRGQESRIVIGVSHEPFSAHCWVQIGDLVLNETVGDVMTHTPIKVI